MSISKERREELRKDATEWHKEGIGTTEQCIAFDLPRDELTALLDIADAADAADGVVDIRLTNEQYKTLCNALLNAQDEGPVPEGWKSDALEALIGEIERQAKAQK